MGRFLSKRSQWPSCIVLARVAGVGNTYCSSFPMGVTHTAPLTRRGATATSSVRTCCLSLREGAPRCAVCSCAPSYSAILLLGAWKTTTKNWVNAKKGKKWPQGHDWLRKCGFLLRTWPGFSPYWLKVESVWLRNPTLPSESLLLTGANLNSTWSGLMSCP